MAFRPGWFPQKTQIFLNLDLFSSTTAATSTFFPFSPSIPVLLSALSLYRGESQSETIVLYIEEGEGEGGGDKARKENNGGFDGGSRVFC